MRPHSQLKVDGGNGPMRILLILSAVFLLAPITAAQRQRELNLMPMPSSVQLGAGQLAIDQSFSAAVTGFQDATLGRSVQRFVAGLSHQTGILFKRKPVYASPTLTIHTNHAHNPIQNRIDEE